jgi:hypothetical protein
MIGRTVTGSYLASLAGRNLFLEYVLEKNRERKRNVLGLG